MPPKDGFTTKRNHKADPDWCSAELEHKLARLAAQAHLAANRLLVHAWTALRRM